MVLLRILDSRGDRYIPAWTKFVWNDYTPAYVRLAREGGVIVDRYHIKFESDAQQTMFLLKWS